MSAQATIDIKKYWTTAVLGGGPITGDFKTKNVNVIAAPLADLLGMTKTYGVYDLVRISVKSGRQFDWRDITILSTVEGDVP